MRTLQESIMDDEREIESSLDDKRIWYTIYNDLDENDESRVSKSHLMEIQKTLQRLNIIRDDWTIEYNDEEHNPYSGEASFWIMYSHRTMFTIQESKNGIYIEYERMFPNKFFKIWNEALMREGFVCEPVFNRYTKKII